MDSPLFYRYYDTLFATKDYAGEVASVFDYCHGYSLQPLGNILELGCGTGNHTLELAKDSGIQVTAVDTDEAMLALAAEKAAAARKTNITFAAGCQAAKNVDLCVALFNVVNYLCTDEQLLQFFAGIAVSLRSQGLFIFDCWNGAAALQDPPGAKYYEQQIDGHKLSCHLTCQTDSARGIALLNYSLQIVDGAGGLIESEEHKIEHRLWTPARIKAALKEAGLDLLSVCIPFKFDIVATDADWKIMFACRKS